MKVIAEAAGRYLAAANLRAMNLPVLAAGVSLLHSIDWGVAWGVIVQTIATVIAAVAAIAAWRAAKATRDTATSGEETAEATRGATQATRDAARQARLGTLIRFHADRLNALAQLHRKISWVTEGGGPRSSLTKMEQYGVAVGIPKGTTIVEGLEIKGMVAATGLDLPNCLAVAEMMLEKKIRGAPVRLADEELRAAMEDENRILAELEADTVVRVTDSDPRAADNMTPAASTSSAPSCDHRPGCRRRGQLSCRCPSLTTTRHLTLT